MAAASQPKTINKSRIHHGLIAETEEADGSFYDEQGFLEAVHGNSLAVYRFSGESLEATC